MAARPELPVTITPYCCIAVAIISSPGDRPNVVRFNEAGSRKRSPSIGEFASVQEPSVRQAGQENADLRVHGSRTSTAWLIAPDCSSLTRIR